MRNWSENVTFQNATCTATKRQLRERAATLLIERVKKENGDDGEQPTCGGEEEGKSSSHPRNQNEHENQVGKYWYL